jgi:hypothetical protein
MDVNKLSVKFKICITTNQFNRALEYLEKISSFFEELMSEDVQLIKRLCRGLIEQNRKILDKMKKTKEEENAKSFLKVPLKDVLSDYSENVLAESLLTIEKILNCVNVLLNKTKKKRLIALMFLIRAKLFKFLFSYSNSDNSRHLESAYINYKHAIAISLKFVDNMDITRIKIFYSYCKFLIKFMNDSYRGVLFCMNLTKEINVLKRDHDDDDDEENEEKFWESSEFKKVESKLKKLIESNILEYNKNINILLSE